MGTDSKLIQVLSNTGATVGPHIVAPSHRDSWGCFPGRGSTHTDTVRRSPSYIPHTAASRRRSLHTFTLISIHTAHTHRLRIFFVPSITMRVAMAPFLDFYEACMIFTSDHLVHSALYRSYAMSSQQIPPFPHPEFRQHYDAHILI